MAGPAVKHLAVRLGVDCGAGQVVGRARYRAEGGAGGGPLELDVRDLDVRGCWAVGPGGERGAALEFSVSEPPHKVLGSKLRIPLPAGSAAVEVAFAPRPSSSALQFLKPEQTAGKVHPFCFTQCQAIHARSFIPCQDVPGTKMTYTAAVHCTEGLTALMGALPREGAPEDVAPIGLPEGVTEQQPVFYFEQPVPISAYLLALAVGDLASFELGERCRIWAEPSMVEAAGFEFAETEKFLNAGEDIMGEFIWGRYDLLMLPPSFPYGGMENPNLTFITPTLMAGDRSLTNVVAHEIAHSWTGNSVSCKTWEHFWLNEGFTVFLERKILGRLFGQSMFEFQASQGSMGLKLAVDFFGAGHNFTRLVPDLSDGKDPDDAFSRIPYEKGFYFLAFLEKLVGGAETFEPFFAAFNMRHRRTAVESSDFRAAFEEAFPDKKVDWDTWFFEPGMPPEENTYDTSLGDKAYALAKTWHFADVMGIGVRGLPEGTSAGDLDEFNTQQIIAFLDKLGEWRCTKALHESTCRLMSDTYGFDQSGNSEIQCAWLELCVKAEDGTVLPACKRFLSRQGRMKYLRPIYRALFKSKCGKELALETFRENRDAYHPIAAKMVAVDLKLDEEPGDE